MFPRYAGRVHRGGCFRHQVLLRGCGQFTVLSQNNLRVWLPCRQRAHIGEAKVARAIASVGVDLLALDDRKCGEDMAHVVAIGDPVEVEEHGVEPGTQDQTALFVPGERWLYLARLIDMTQYRGRKGAMSRAV